MAATSFDPRNPQLGPSANSGGMPNIRYGIYEAASQSFKAGQFVYLDASGAATAVAADGTSVFGIALKDGTNTSSASALVEIPVVPIYPADELLIKTTNSGSAALANTAQPGEPYSLAVASGLISVDLADESNGAVIFQQELRDSSGASTYWGKFHLLDTVAQAVSG
jgi:hypothetical protein